MADVAQPGTCQACGRPLPPQHGRGRTRRYCDAKCRDTARRQRERPARAGQRSVKSNLTNPPRHEYLDAIDGISSPGDSVAASVAALLELRLGEAGRDALGFAVHVPHYLSQAVYPEAAVALLDTVTAITGLELPSDALRLAADRTNSEIDRQVAESTEVAELVTALERQYDAIAESGDTEGGDLLDGGQMPTADELAAQFERFLEQQDRNEG